MSEPEVRKERRFKLPFLEIRVQTVEEPVDEGVVDAASLGADQSGAVRGPGLFPGGLLILPLVVVLSIRLVGGFVFNWSYYTGHWPLWFTALFIVAIGCALLGAYLERRDRKERAVVGR